MATCIQPVFDQFMSYVLHAKYKFVYALFFYKEIHEKKKNKINKNVTKMTKVKNINLKKKCYGVIGSQLRTYSLLVTFIEFYVIVSCETLVS